jgi:NADH-quinone oxidoreductase subunit J
MDAQALLFWILATMTGVSAVGVLVTQNIVRSATWLLFALAGTAGIFFLLGADFVGATQLLVYVGGTLVLVVFGVMLTAQGPFITMRTSAAEWAVAIVVGTLLYGVLVISIVLGTDKMLPSETGSTMAADPARSMNTVDIGQALLGIDQVTPAARVAGTGQVRKPVSYLLPFEIVSVHLLVVLIGAAYLARAKRRRSAIA